MEYTIVSSLPHVVCLSMSSSSRCAQNHYNRPTLVSKNNNCINVWLLVRSSEVVVPFHYAHMPLKTDTRQKISGDRSCTHVPTWLTKTLRHAHRRAHWPHVLRLSTYSHSHYSDEPNKEMHTVLFTLPHVTHTVNTRTNQTDTWLCLTYAL